MAGLKSTLDEVSSFLSSYDRLDQVISTDNLDLPTVLIFDGINVNAE